MEVSASQCSVQCPVQRVCACVLCCIVCVDDATPAAVTHTTIVTSSFLSLFFRYTTGRVFGLEAFPDGTQYQGEVRYVNARRDGKVVLWSERLVSTAGAGGVRGAGGGGAGGGRQEEEGAERAGAEGGAETGAGAGAGAPGATIRPTIVMVPGACSQATFYTDRWTAPLLAAGYDVVRFDLRGTGRSSWTERGDSSSLFSFFSPSSEDGDPSGTPSGGGAGVPPNEWFLQDMGRDVLAVAAAWDLPSFHTMGVSIGGLVAVEAALMAPHKVRSILTVASQSGRKEGGKVWDVLDDSGFAAVGVGTTRAPSGQYYKKGYEAASSSSSALLPDVLEYLREGTLSERVAASQQYVTLLSSPTHGRDTDAHDALHASTVLRMGFNPECEVVFHKVARRSPGRIRRLRTLRVPALCVCGEEDPLVPLQRCEAMCKGFHGAVTHTMGGTSHILHSEEVGEVSIAHLDFLRRVDGGSLG